MAQGPTLGAHDMLDTVRALDTVEAHDEVFLVNAAVELPTAYGRCRFAPGKAAPAHLFDFNYLDRARTERVLPALEAFVARSSPETRTLLLAARGLDPHPEALLTLARRYAHHHVFTELWNLTAELEHLAAHAPEHLYFLPVTAMLTDVGARLRNVPNRNVFLSVGGDDDLALLREVVRLVPRARFFLPRMAWTKGSYGRREHEVRFELPNVRPVACRPDGFSFDYVGSYARCDTVVVAPSAAKSLQMRGGIRVADALRARKRLVLTRNPACELTMARHEETALVVPHDAEAIAAALDRVLAGRFDPDRALVDAMAALTDDVAKVRWMALAWRDPERAQRSPFWRDPATLRDEALALGLAWSLGHTVPSVLGVTRGDAIAVDGGAPIRVGEIRKTSEATFEIDVTLSGGTFVLGLSTAPLDAFFARTARGHWLWFRGQQLTREQDRAAKAIASRL